MAVAIALDKTRHSASLDAQSAGLGASASASRGTTPFAAVLAKTQAQGSRRTGAPRTPSATPGRANETKSADANPSQPVRTAGAKRATPPQRSDTQAGTTAPSTPNTPGDNGAGSPPGHAAAQPRGANTTPAKTADDGTAPPAPALPPPATTPVIAQNAAAEASLQTDSGTSEPSNSEQFATFAATVIPTPGDSTAPSGDVDHTASLDAAPTESLAAPAGKPAILPAPAAAGQDANTADGALQPHQAPTDAAASSPSPQEAPQSAPASPEWAEARETVALRMTQAVQDSVQNVSIDLHPAELGHVGIELSFHAGGVSVQMTLSRQDTYDAFSRDRAALEQQLAQSGIDLGGGGLDLRFDQKRDQAPASSGNAFAARIQSAQPDAAMPAAARPRIASGLLNIIA